MTWREEEEEREKGKVKEFHFYKQVGFVLERENKFFLERERGNPKCIGEEVEWLFFGRTISFGGERTKVRGLNLMMTRTFSWGINNYFFI